MKNTPSLQSFITSSLHSLVTSSLHLLIPFFLIPSSLLAQVPQGIPYQAVIRDNAGAPLVNTPILVRFTLHQNTTDGAIEYQETQSATTNAFGVINTQFGTGTATQGTFAGIVWSNTSKFIQVEANDGNGYMDMGTQQMMSVPYAMYAGSAGNQSFPNGSTNGDMLYWDTNTESWISVPAGVNGQAIYFCDGVPTWGGCVPVLGNVSVSSITPYTAYAEFPMVTNGGSAPTTIGFYLSTSSDVSPSNGQFLGGTWPGCSGCFVSNSMNSLAASLPGGNGTVKSGNDGATSISNLTPNTQYYIVGSVSNAKGSSLTPVLTFSTPILVEGCMEGGACNYNPQANYNLGCYYAAYGYLCDGSCAGDIDQDGVCDAFDACSDINACNYNNPGNPGCAFDSDGDNVCDDQDGCLDFNACNFASTSPFENCVYPPAGYYCDSTCVNDLDNDGICDVVDSFICSNDIDNDLVCDDIDQCTDINACNYNTHYLDVIWPGYNCRYDIDNDGICSPPTGMPLPDSPGLSSSPMYYLSAIGQPTPYFWGDFDYCEDLTACNVTGNGLVDGTIMNYNGFDLGLVNSYMYTSLGGGGYSIIYQNAPLNIYTNVHFGCAYDIDSDGICDLQDRCRDISACNFNLPENDWCYLDQDGDNICDNLDGCFDMSTCNYNNPLVTECVDNGGQCDDGNPATFFDYYDWNSCNCISSGVSTCTDVNACNYANMLADLCQYPNPGFDCAGNCLQALCIGQDYQGGKVAYIFQPGDAGYVAGETHGLIAASQDLSGNFQWGCYGTNISGAEGQAIGTGAQNTMDIVIAGCGGAAQACADLVLNGYSDWFLPSLYELQQLYNNRSAIGGFIAGDFYSSSSEQDSDSIWCFVMYEDLAGGPAIDAKDVNYPRVRAVRAF